METVQDEDMVTAENE